MLKKCIHLKMKMNGDLYCKQLKKIIPLKFCTGCLNKQYKQYKIKKRTKALAISKSVKSKVWERDRHRCVFCDTLVPLECANSHYIKRSHGGLGIEQNILTNCEVCHRLFDDSPRRAEMFQYATNYLEMKYPNWHDIELTYKKS